MPTPIAILNRKVFLDGSNVTYTTEPINLQGYRKAILGLTVHGLSVEPVQYVALSFEHTSSPETNIDSNWVALTPSTGSLRTTKGTETYIVSDFFPWVRMTLNITSGGGSGNLRIAEVSLGGHAFETKD